MDKQTKKIAVILGIVDAIVLLIFIFALIANIAQNAGASTSSGKVALEVQFDGGTIVGNDSYVIKGDEGAIALPEDDEDKTEIDGDYIFPESDSEYLKESDLEGLSAWELKVARNEIYARHGRMFDDNALSDYFNGKSWYEPIYTPEEFDAKGDSVFNKYEIANRDLIRAYEKR